MTEHKKSSAVVIFNDRGELALQLRAVHDDSFPSHWDFAAGGGIDEGEEEKQSAEREVHEELGVEVDAQFITRKHYTYQAWKPGVTRETDLWIYKVQHNGPFAPDLGEVEKIQFFGPEEIKKMMESGTKFHPEFVLAWNEGIVAKALE